VQGLRNETVDRDGLDTLTKHIKRYVLHRLKESQIVDFKGEVAHIRRAPPGRVRTCMPSTHVPSLAVCPYSIESAAFTPRVSSRKMCQSTQPCSSPTYEAPVSLCIAWIALALEKMRPAS